MKRYTHLTSEQRYQISNGLKQGYSQQTIANIIGVNKSTISREIRCNGGSRNFPSENAVAVVNSTSIAFSLREIRNGDDE